MKSFPHGRLLQRYGISAALVAFGAASMVGCAAQPAEEDDIIVDERSDALVRPDGAALWPGGQVPVCWNASTQSRPSFPAESRTLRNRALTTWAAVAKVDFNGWGTCPSSVSDRVRLTVNDETESFTDGIGMGDRNIFFGTRDFNFYSSAAPHLFGHALGFGHEMARADFPDSTVTECQEANVPGDTLNTPPDQGSIMASVGFCQNNPNLSLWDVFGAQTAYGRRLNGMRVLVNAYHDGRGDHFATATDVGIQSARDAGYRFAYADGWIFSVPAPGTVPLKLYWHAGRGDNMVTATSGSEGAAKGAGYTFVRTEGYVYPTPQPGTSPLRHFWSAARQDNFTTTTSEGAAAALAAGYVEVGVEGYVFTSRPYDLLWLYWHGGRGDYMSTAEASSLADAADGAAYSLAGFDGAVLKSPLPGTAPLKTYWSAAREDYFVTATAAGEASAIQAGYTYLRTEGYVFSSPVSGLVPLDLYWNGARGDNFTTSSRAFSAIQQGYSFARTEGYVLGLN